jgi:hypothetical protein
MTWQKSIKFIIKTSEVCDFYTIDHQLISFNKQGTLCFNRGGQWHPDEERENKYKRIDLDIINRKLAEAGLVPIISSLTAFSIHSWHFLEYLDGLGLLDKITYLAYSDPHISLPIKYIKKMSALKTLIIDTSTTRVFDKPTDTELEYYRASLAELVIQLPPTLEILFIHFPTFNGSMANLPPGLRILCIISYAFNESLDYLPLSLEVLILLQLRDFKHDIQNLPPLLKMLALDLENNRCYTSAVQLPLELEYLLLTMRSSNSFLCAIGKEDCENIRNLKKIICNSHWSCILNEKKISNGILQNTIITNADHFHYTNIINELLLLY